MPRLFEPGRARRCGGLADAELLRTFNAGVGLVIVLKPGDVAAAKGALKAAGEAGVWDLGVLENRASGAPGCVVDGSFGEDLRQITPEK